MLKAPSAGAWFSEHRLQLSRLSRSDGCLERIHGTTAPQLPTVPVPEDETPKAHTKHPSSDHDMLDGGYSAATVDIVEEPARAEPNVQSQNTIAKGP
jgi:hypothetical protein